MAAALDEGSQLQHDQQHRRHHQGRTGVAQVGAGDRADGQREGEPAQQHGRIEEGGEHRERPERGATNNPRTTQLPDHEVPIDGPEPDLRIFGTVFQTGSRPAAASSRLSTELGPGNAAGPGMQQGQAPDGCLALLGWLVVRVLVTYWPQLAVKAASSMTKEVCSELSSTPVKLTLVVPAGTVKDFWT